MTSQSTQQPAAGRHKSRRHAMMVLYKLDLMPQPVDQAIEAWKSEHDFDLPAYARELVEGVDANLDAIDAVISANLDEWSIDRLGAVERSVLRLAVHELRVGAVPAGVVIDEALELAKRYASPEAAKLVNGVLGAIVRGKDS